MSSVCKPRMSDKLWLFGRNLRSSPIYRCINSVQFQFNPISYPNIVSIINFLFLLIGRDRRAKCQPSCLSPALFSSPLATENECARRLVSKRGSVVFLLQLNHQSTPDTRPRPRSLLVKVLNSAGVRSMLRPVQPMHLSITVACADWPVAGL